ncbi:MAG: c-type cytochrome [Pseudomonadales bacterium]
MNKTAANLCYCLSALALTLIFPVRADEATEPVTMTSVAQKWARSCALCHVDGNGGAPRIGHAEDWQPRLAKGQSTLLRHTIEGLNAMPPLGYCMDCEREDFVALIELMTRSISVDNVEPRQ